MIGDVLADHAAGRESLPRDVQGMLHAIHPSTRDAVFVAGIEQGYHLGLEQAIELIGVRGIRVNISPIRKPEAGLAASMRPRIARLTKICKELGWHLDFLTPGWLVSELMPTLRELPIEFTVAHMGLFPAKDGPGQAGFQEFLKLAGDGSKTASLRATMVWRNCWRDRRVRVYSCDEQAQALYSAMPVCPNGFTALAAARR